MTFLNPIFLWASLAVAIPIIVHLFNFRRPKKVQFSDISLVKEVKQSVVRRLRLRQWLLLAARCLLILALVAVFAQPVWRSNNVGAVQGNTSVAIVLDNSYSMRGGNDKGSYWLQAQKVATEILKAYSRNDEFLVMANNEPLLNFNFAEQQAANRALKELQIQQNTQSLGELLAVSEDIFGLSTQPNKALFFISDFQESTVLPDSSFSLSKADGIDVTLVPLTTRKLKNAFVKDHSLTTQIVEKEKPVNLKLELVNDAPDPVKNVGLRMVVGTETRPVATEDLEGGASAEVNIAITPKTAGWQSGYIELDDYPVEYDNRRFFSYYVPDREKMLVVEETPVPNLRLMLGGGIMSQFDTRIISYKDLGEENLDAYKSILLVGVNDISTGLQEKLTAHLQQGKSILFFPGQKINPTSVNRFFQSLKMGTFGGAQQYEKGQFAAGVDLDHPVFDGVFVGKKTARNFDAPLVYQHYSFRPANAVVQNVILRMGNQDPILVESRPEGGLLYTFTMFPGDSWTDFTLKSSGLTIMVQLARMMNQSQQVQQNEVLGGNGYKRIKTKEKEVIKMVGQDGNEIIPEQFVQNGYIVLKFDKQNLTEGNYDLVQQEKLLEKISFNVPDAESRLQALNEPELKEYLEQAGMDGVAVSPALSGQFASEIQMKSEGVPLWKYFLMAALLFLVVEFIILQTKDRTVPAT